MKIGKHKFEKLDIFIFILMVGITIVTIYPFLNVLAISFNDANDTVRGGLHIWPREFTLSNYKEIFSGSSKLCKWSEKNG